MRGEPNIRQQFIELICRMGRQTTEDVVEVGEGIHVVSLTGGGQGVQDRRRPAATIAPQERPVAPSDGLGTQHPLGEVVVDAQLPVFGVAT
jgi:hypothetical protein